MTPEQELKSKRILIEFVGGFKDGMTLDSRSADEGEVTMAAFYYVASEGGKEGKGGMSVSDAALGFARQHGMDAAKTVGFRMSHVYRAFEKLDQGDEILVRFRYSQE